MDYELGGVTGDWGPADWLDPSGISTTNGAGQANQSVLGQTTQSAGQDQWVGIFKSLIPTVANYAIQRDAAKNGLRQLTTPNGQPQYVPASTMPATVGGVNMGAVLLIGGAALVAVVLVAATARK